MFSIVIVTYKQDLDKLETCLDSLSKHASNFKKILIINDDATSLPLFQKFIDKQTDVVHCLEIADWYHSFDWWSQQYFKLAVAQCIQTPWYLLIDSDDLIVQDITNDTLFRGSRAICLIETLTILRRSPNQVLIKWLENACTLFNMGMPAHTMGNLTPFMMHTVQARELFKLISTDQFNTNFPEKLTLEFYLYYVWLYRNQLFEQLYHPVDLLQYALDKRNLRAI